MTKILIVDAPYYPQIAEPLLAGAIAALQKGGAQFDRVCVTGALEIPAAIVLAEREGTYDGYVALGCVIRGETFHFEIVAGESARGLMDLAIQRGLCIGNGILTVDSDEQAIVRAAPDRGDKGGDAARACLALIGLRDGFGAQR